MNIKISKQQKKFSMIVFLSSLLFGLLLVHFIRNEIYLGILFLAPLFAFSIFSSGLMLGIKDDSDPFGWNYHLITYLFMNSAYLLALIIQKAAASFYQEQLLMLAAWGVLLLIHHKLIGWYKYKTEDKAT